MVDRRRRTAAKEVAAEIGGRAVVADLSDPDARRRARRPTSTSWSTTPGSSTWRRSQEFPPERFAYILRVMVEAPFRLVRRALPRMYARGWGRIVNISSVHGLRASPYKAAYVTAKHALEGLSKVVALEGAAARRHLQLHQPRLRPHRRWSRARSPTRRRSHGIAEDEVVEKIMLAPRRDQAADRAGGGGRAGRLPVLARRRRSSPARRSPIDGGWTAR